MFNSFKNRGIKLLCRYIWILCCALVRKTAKTKQKLVLLRT